MRILLLAALLCAAPALAIDVPDAVRASYEEAGMGVAVVTVHVPDYAREVGPGDRVSISFALGPDETPVVLDALEVVEVERPWPEEERRMILAVALPMEVEALVREAEARGMSFDIDDVTFEEPPEQDLNDRLWLPEERLPTEPAPPEVV